MTDLICHKCNTGELVQIGASSDERGKKWFFICSNACPVKYTIIEESFPSVMIEVILKDRCKSPTQITMR